MIKMRFKAHIKMQGNTDPSILHSNNISDIIQTVGLVMFHEKGHPILVTEEGKGGIWYLEDGNDLFFGLEK